MITVCQSYEDHTLMAEKYKIMKINVVAYVGTVYGSCAFFILEGLRKMYVGSHFVTVVTYYPSYGDDTAIANFVRVCGTLVLLVMMVTMIVSVDSFTMVYIIMYKYKFITLRHYFENLREEVERLNQRDNNLAEEKVLNGLIEGIEMHSNLLKLSKEIDKAFGTVMALQLCQSSGSAVSILLQIAASLVSDAIFYCGWHLCPPRVNNMPRRNIRQLVVLALMQAQRPLVMKAFKMVELSYATFLMVWTYCK
ncbi:unnamed protein product [Arctia plantaginis]|uniref:Odorant receptor n=1 Tax=Arctia plantaginis TaxID=874455 RepID=A0A8S1AGX9_ARCPL|nr:unnamed protein product [Arctia plantaginis]